MQGTKKSSALRIALGAFALVSGSTGRGEIQPGLAVVTGHDHNGRPLFAGQPLLDQGVDNVSYIHGGDGIVWTKTKVTKEKRDALVKAVVADIGRRTEIIKNAIFVEPSDEEFEGKFAKAEGKTVGELVDTTAPNSSSSKEEREDSCGAIGCGHLAEPQSNGDLAEILDQMIGAGIGDENETDSE